MNERDALANYLNSGRLLCLVFGYDHCPFECGVPDEELDMSELTDGTWAWPKSLTHYIGTHHISLPDQFLHHARLHGFSIPPKTTRADGWPEEDVPFSDANWIDWSRRRNALRPRLPAEVPVNARTSPRPRPSPEALVKARKPPEVTERKPITRGELARQLQQEMIGGIRRRYGCSEGAAEQILRSVVGEMDLADETPVQIELEGERGPTFTMEDLDRSALMFGLHPMKRVP